MGALLNWKKYVTKNKCIVKTVLLKLRYSRTPCYMPSRITTQSRSVTVEKMAGITVLFFQNASGNPSCNFPRRALHAREVFQKWNYWKRFTNIPWPVKDWVTLIYFQLEGTSWKIDLDDFVDEFDSPHDKWRIKLHWGDDDINSNVDYARICVRIVWICLGVELVRSTQG